MNVGKNKILEKIKEPASCEIKPKGFTLFEVLIVLALITILFGISLPELSKYFDRINLQQSSNSIISILSNSKRQAQEKFVKQEITILTQELHASNRPLFSLPAHFHFEATFPGNKIFFHGSGVASPGTLKIVSNQNSSCTVSMSLRGRVLKECEFQ
jgi:prepilin-type N-terminal cleavage/methylation domain-containing protein